MNTILIAPSILSADFARLGDECRRMLSLGADWLHIDVMDGHFVPNLTIGPPVISAIRRACPTAFLDCHLMIESPELWIERTVRAGASSITFHSEATSDPVALARRIKAAGVAAAVAIKPDTPVSELSAELLSVVDMVLVMTVEPGFGGQQLLPVAVDKVRQLRQERHFSRRIQVDGGVGLENSALVKDAGADVLVAGSSIFSASDPGDIIKLLRQQ